MEGKTQLEKLRQSVMNIHKLALSHIVATDYSTMITLVHDIKEEEKNLDDMLTKYEIYITNDDRETYNALRSDCDSLKHALIFLVCASASQNSDIVLNRGIESRYIAIGTGISVLCFAGCTGTYEKNKSVFRSCRRTFSSHSGSSKQYFQYQPKCQKCSAGCRKYG